MDPLMVPVPFAFKKPNLNWKECPFKSRGLSSSPLLNQKVTSDTMELLMLKKPPLGARFVHVMVPFGKAFTGMAASTFPSVL
jgi:hypothetical protein